MVFSFSLSSCPDHRGLTAPLPNPPQTVRSERQRPGKLKIGGNLQGEPIFCFPGPSADLLCAVSKPPVAGRNLNLKENIADPPARSILHRDGPAVIGGGISVPVGTEGVKPDPAAMRAGGM
jgi:hypothetical protein